MNANPPLDSLATPRRSATSTIQLAIETSTRGGSAAIFTNQSICSAQRLPEGQRSAAMLIPVIAAMLQCGDDEANVVPQVVAVADGPGSFTGLRVAVTAAKSLAYAWNAPLIAVDTLAATAATAMHDRPNIDTVDVVVNAYRGQVFAGRFERSDLFDKPQLAVIQGNDVFVCQADELPAEFPRDDSVLRITDAPTVDADHALSDFILAIGVAKLAQSLQASQAPSESTIAGSVDAMALTPRYLKVSAAEEKRAEG